jgi:hypothetical protein
VPIASARRVADPLPHCSATYYPNDGHLSVIINHGHEIITALAG